MVIQIVMGSIFLFFSILMFILFNCVPGDVQGSLLAGNCMLLFFMLIGLAFIVSGIRIFIRDKKTDLKGEFCYGQITDVVFNGIVVNGVKQFDACLKVYIESTGEFITCRERIGFFKEEFDVGSFYALKYYNNDINYEYRIPSFDALPENIREVFDTGEIIPDEVEMGSGLNTTGTKSQSTDDTAEKMRDYVSRFNYDYELEAVRKAEEDKKMADEKAMNDEDFSNDAFKEMMKHSSR